MLIRIGKIFDTLRKSVTRILDLFIVVLIAFWGAVCAGVLATIFAATAQEKLIVFLITAVLVFLTFTALEFAGSAWKQSILHFIYRLGRAVPKPIKFGLLSSGRHVASFCAWVSDIAVEAWQLFSKALVWIVCSSVAAGLGYVVIKGVAALPVSVAIILGAVIIATALASASSK